MLKSRIALAAGLLFGAAVAVPAQAAVVLLGVGSIPGNATDQSGLSGLLEDGVTPKNQVGGFGSAITYSGKNNRFLATPDRGPADGTTSYIDRLYKIDLKLKSTGPYGPNSYTVTPTLSGTSLLSNKSGEQYTGYNLEFDATGSTDSLRLDPEGIRADHCGDSVYVSDEYGPYLYQFKLNGQQTGKPVKLPAKLGIDLPSSDPAAELANNAFGRQANRGMEGLAISPDGSKLFGLMQNALIQDGALDPALKRVATNSRLIEINQSSGEIKEYYYPLETKDYGLNEILAVNDHQFLVIERDGKAGASAAFKKLYLIDIAGATDIRGIKSLPATGVPSGVTPVSKTLFLDLLDPAYGLAGASFPEKIEGLAFGPDLKGGQHTLIVTNDNDFVTANPSNFYVFGIDAADLPGYQPQQFGSCDTTLE
ncbi:esterase-like activity of phytase family protein [Hydrocarboniphaga sp.]|uniref:esterase-like activity of phytase family protein n=1 Tax=Hydrocarboniphaga sp. TaxID=2033016 RepID=UPI003D133D16